jgi:hypothetical protein
LTAALRRGLEWRAISPEIHLRTTLMNSFTTAQKIEACEVPADERLRVLPRHFGRQMITVEGAIYDFMRTLAHEYTGGCWKFVELSNGGFYMAPESEIDFEIAVEGNGFEGTMTAQAAGITACLFAFSHLSFRIENERIASHFHLLRDFALEDPEAGAILAAID